MFQNLVPTNPQCNLPLSDINIAILSDFNAVSSKALFSLKLPKTSKHISTYKIGGLIL